MLTSIFQEHNKAKEVCIKTRSPSASHSLEGQGTKSTTVKSSIHLSTVPLSGTFVGPEIETNQRNLPKGCVRQFLTRNLWTTRAFICNDSQSIRCQDMLAIVFKTIHLDAMPRISRWITVPDPDHEKRGGGQGGGRHPDPQIRGGPGLQKKFFSAFRSSDWSENKGGGLGLPGTLPWIRHWIIIKQELRHTICGEQTNSLFPALRPQLTVYVYLGTHLQ